MKIITFPEANAWIACCVEYDICAQGPDEQTARNRLNSVIQLDLAESIRRTGRPFGGIGPLPPEVIALAAIQQGTPTI